MYGVSGVSSNFWSLLKLTHQIIHIIVGCQTPLSRYRWIEYQFPTQIKAIKSVFQQGRCISTLKSQAVEAGSIFLSMKVAHFMVLKVDEESRSVHIELLKNHGAGNGRLSQSSYKTSSMSSPRFEKQEVSETTSKLYRFQFPLKPPKQDPYNNNLTAINQPVHLN